MKFTLITAALAAMSSAVSAQKAIVNSKCDTTVFLQSFPFDGSAPGPFTIIKPGGTAYVETFRSTGSTIKMSNKRTLDKPLFFGYTNQQTQVFYQLTSDQGNPFAAFRNKLIPSNPACGRFNCAANKDACYSHNNNKVIQCGKPTNLTVTLCAPA